MPRVSAGAARFQETLPASTRRIDGHERRAAQYGPAAYFPADAVLAVVLLALTGSGCRRLPVIEPAEPLRFRKACIWWYGGFSPAVACAPAFLAAPRVWRW